MKTKEELEALIAKEKLDSKEWEWTIVIPWYGVGIIVIYMLIGISFGTYYLFNPRKI